MKNAPEKIVIEQLKDHVLTVSFNPPHYNNPFSAELEKALTTTFHAANANDDVHVVVITGGHSRSFSVGGDFNEVKNFEGGDEVDQWIGDIIDMYVACCEIEKPTIAALDRYVIGIGFQLALCCDFRLGTSRTQLIMPELKNGIACVLGQYMLEKNAGQGSHAGNRHRL